MRLAFSRVIALPLLVFSLVTFAPISLAQNGIKVEMTESYELSNIILALTQYGRTDKWDVQKIPPYYQEILNYFEPVKHHPLLEQVNYSRKEWEKFLGFRTDMYAFAFDANGVLKRAYPFNSFGNQEVDAHLALINDFVAKSNYRQFYRDHQALYQQIQSNYLDYYYVTQSEQFLKKIAGQSKAQAKRNYVIAISPLVGGQNCHRDIDANTTVDFPNISKDLILGKLDTDLPTRVTENHILFTEMDHGYVNPISDKFARLIRRNFDHQKWDHQSGYQGLDSFNEYMTWAVYDLFIREHFPEQADRIALNWQYQNAARGFIAQSLFSQKLAQLYAQSKTKRLADLYTPLLQWTRSVGSKIKQPVLLGVDEKTFVAISSPQIELNFSETMNTEHAFTVRLAEMKNGQSTDKAVLVEVTQGKWSHQGKELAFNIDSPFEEFALILNWWDNDKPLVSKNGVLLKPESTLLLKKKSE